MDVATLAGILSGFSLILISIYLGGTLSAFVNFPSIMIVFGGTIGSTLVNFPLTTVMDVFKVVRKTFFHEAESPTAIIDTMVSMSEKSRREGILAIEKYLPDLKDPFLREGMQLAVDGSEPDVIRSVLNNELANLEARHKTGQAVLHAMGTYAPAFGMIGTLIGLINMLRLMDDPSKIGPGMAVALVTTFYGSILANCLFLPMEGKLKSRTQQEILKREMIIEGVLSIQSGDNPRIVRSKLLTFLAPKDRSEKEVKK